MAEQGNRGGGSVCVGEIGAPRGLRGEFCVRSFTADPRAIGAYGPLTPSSGGPPLHLRIVGEKKGSLVVQAEGVDDRDKAEALRGCRLFVPRAALPTPEDEEYYYADLVGLRAVLPEQGGNDALARVAAVHDYGAGPVLEIERAGAPPVLVPFSKAAVPEVDLEAGHVVVSAVPGLLAPAEEGER